MTQYMVIENGFNGRKIVSTHTKYRVAVAAKRARIALGRGFEITVEKV